MSANPIPESWEAIKLATPDHTPQFGIYARGEMSPTAIVTGPHAKARARFIEAAPDLLEALEDLMEMRDKCFIPNNGDWWDRKACAAIAKARGEA